MRRKKYFGSFLGFFLAAVLTVGCAGGSGPATDGTGTPAANVENSPDGSGSATDGTGTPAANVESSLDGISGAASVPVSKAEAAEITGERLYPGEYTRLLLRDSVSAEDYQSKRLYADAYDGVIYILEEYMSGEGEDMSRQFFLTTYGSGATELSWEPFALDFPEKGQWFIRSMAVPEAGQLSFWVYEHGSGGMEDVSEFLAVTDLKGNLLSLPESIPKAEEYPWRIGSRVVRGADGSMAISRMEQDQTVFYSYDPETGRREKIEVSVEVPYVSAIYPEGNMLYYVDGALQLYRWDDGEKKLTDMMNLAEISFPWSRDFTFILPGGAGRLLLCSLSTEMLQVFALSEEEYHSENEIRMSILRDDFSTGYKLDAVLEYSYAHPNCPISTEKAEGNEEDAFRNRIMAQIAAGKGPDLMLVSADDMSILAGKDVLLDLAELIPEETMGQLFQCVIQEGTVNGKMYGLMTEFTIDTLLTADATWSGDSWTLEEFLELQEEYQWEWPIGEGFLTMNPMRCLKSFLPDLGHSKFLDMEAGIARFDSNEFVRILEICKNYESYNSEGPGHGRERMLAQECGACATWIDSTSFSDYLSEYGGKAHFVGYPAEGGGNFMWTFGTYLVVNANSEHKEEIKEYIAMLLDYDRQMNSNGSLGISARRDVIRDSGIQNSKPDGTTYLGTTYLEEFLDFVDGCKASGKWPSLIEQIMEEELAPYFKGDKSAREAVALVQNRVQLYLDEQR